VAEKERFNVVRKHVAEGVLAKETDPRN
jgi:hypothetical protein